VRLIKADDYMKYFFFVTTILFLSSCLECADVDCRTDSYFEFIILGVNDESLFNISDQPYSLDSLSFTAISEAGSLDVDFFLLSGFISVPLSKEYDKMIISYGSHDRDTLSIFDQAFSNEEVCCKSVLVNYSLALGNDLFCENCADVMWVIEK